MPRNQSQGGYYPRDAYGNLVGTSQSSSYPAYPTTSSRNTQLSTYQAPQQQVSYAARPSTSSSSQHGSSHAPAQYAGSHNQSADMTREERRRYFENLNTTNPEATQQMIYYATTSGDSPSVCSTAFARATNTPPTTSYPSWDHVESMTPSQRIHFLKYVNERDPGFAQELIRDELARVDRTINAYWSTERQTDRHGDVHALAVAEQLEIDRRDARRLAYNTRYRLHHLAPSRDRDDGGS